MKSPFLIVLLSFFLCSHIQFIATSEEDLVSQFIEKHGQAFLKNKSISSVSIGIVKDGQAYTGHFGELIKGQGQAPDNASVYEIGSVTKTIVGYLVAQAVVDGQLALDEDVNRYLNGEFPNLSYQGKSLTLRHLLTHTSGLPITLPQSLNEAVNKLDDKVPQRYQQIESSYTQADFLTDLKGIVLKVEPGTKYSYSNAGIELVGHILENAYGKSIDQLLTEHLLDKSGMTSTFIHTDQSQDKRIVQGYWMNNAQPSPALLNNLWGTAGGAKMSMNDMLRYMEWQLNTAHPIVAESHKALYEENFASQVAYCWRVRKDKYGTSYSHHGGTTGTQNWLFIFPDYDMAISIITNHSGPKTPGQLSKTVKKLLKDLLKV